MIHTKPWPRGVGGQALCDCIEDIERVDRRLSEVIRPELKQDHSMRRQLRNLFKDLMACRSDDVDLFHFILVTKKFGVRDCQPVLVPLRFAGDDCDRICIWIEDEERDRSSPAFLYG